MKASWAIAAGCFLPLMSGALASRLPAADFSRSSICVALFSLVEIPATDSSEPAEPADSNTPKQGSAPVVPAPVIPASKTEPKSEQKTEPKSERRTEEKSQQKSEETSAGKPSEKSAVPADEKTAPRKPEVLIKDRQFRREAPEGALRVSFDDLDLLKVLNMEPVTADCVEMMPRWLKDLNGRKVRIRGYMHPAVADPDANSEFALARDTQICCFGRSPKIYDIIQVTLKQGVTTRYIELRPFDVIGTLRIEIDPEDFKARKTGDDKSGEDKPGEEVDEYDLLNLGGLYYLDDATLVVR